ncbi:MAG TPA: Gfo/Idh/MocA family oxidoreductase [Planctomycetota bacterium]|nr:Gfo/Idh/MocA family oxidoreductase [Planctomycetota bacterium]
MRKLSRRQFIGQSAAVAAPFVVPASVFGRQGAPAPSGRLTLGFIGCGTMAYGHLKRALGMKEVQVLAVCDVDTDRRTFFKKATDSGYSKQNDTSYKGCADYNDYREIIARKDIDAVVISTPDHWHTIPAVEAMKAGKDVYCEKPLTLTIREAKLMLDAARKYERVLQTGSQQRSDWEFQVAINMVKKGALGKIKQVIVDVGGPSKPCDLKEEEMQPGLDWDRWLGPAPKRPYNAVLSPRGVHTHFPAWRNYKEYSGGMMTDWGAHHFDITQGLLGMDESGPVEIIPPEDPSKGRGVKYVYENGVEVIHGTSGGVKVIGENGEITVNRGKLSSAPETLVAKYRGEKGLKSPQVPDEFLPEKPVGHFQNWLTCVKSRQKPIADVEIGARSVTVCHLGNLAYWHGQKLKWDPKAWTFADGTGKAEWLDRERREPYVLPSLT